MTDYQGRVTYTTKDGKNVTEKIEVKANSKTEATKKIEALLKSQGATNIDVNRVA